uniref:Uncharacterized protein n=1 Tax=Parastrongyloides trichosuri TaxID=131310 RepID=A0A0N4Z6C7_PARTI
MVSLHSKLFYILVLIVAVSAFYYPEKLRDDEASQTLEKRDVEKAISLNASESSGLLVQEQKKHSVSIIRPMPRPGPPGLRRPGRPGLRRPGPPGLRRPGPPGLRRPGPPGGGRRPLPPKKRPSPPRRTTPCPPGRRPF